MDKTREMTIEAIYIVKDLALSYDRIKTEEIRTEPNAICELTSIAVS